MAAAASSVVTLSIESLPSSLIAAVKRSPGYLSDQSITHPNNVISWTETLWSREMRLAGNGQSSTSSKNCVPAGEQGVAWGLHFGVWSRTGPWTTSDTNLKLQPNDPYLTLPFVFWSKSERVREQACSRLVEFLRGRGVVCVAETLLLETARIAEWIGIDMNISEGDDDVGAFKEVTDEEGHGKDDDGSAKNGGVLEGVRGGIGGTVNTEPQAEDDSPKTASTDLNAPNPTKTSSEQRLNETQVIQQIDIVGSSNSEILIHGEETIIPQASSSIQGVPGRSIQEDNERTKSHISTTTAIPVVASTEETMLGERTEGTRLKEVEVITSQREVTESALGTLLDVVGETFDGIIENGGEETGERLAGHDGAGLMDVGDRAMDNGDYNNDYPYEGETSQPFDHDIGEGSQMLQYGPAPEHEQHRKRTRYDGALRGVGSGTPGAYTSTNDREQTIDPTLLNNYSQSLNRPLTDPLEGDEDESDNEEYDPAQSPVEQPPSPPRKRKPAAPAPSRRHDKKSKKLTSHPSQVLIEDTTTPSASSSKVPVPKAAIPPALASTSASRERAGSEASSQGKRKYSTQGVADRSSYVEEEYTGDSRCKKCRWAGRETCQGLFYVSRGKFFVICSHCQEAKYKCNLKELLSADEMKGHRARFERESHSQSVGDEGEV